MRSLLALAVAAVAVFALHSCAPAEVSADDTIAIRGSVLLPDGAPAVGARVQRVRMDANGDLESVEDRTDADGRYRHAASASESRSIVLYVSHPGYATMRFAHPAEARDLDVEPLRLSPAGVVVVQLVDSEGGVPPGEWSAWLDSPDADDDAPVRAAPRPRAVSPEDGIARFEDVLPGTWNVKARTDSTGWVRPDAPAEVRAGETTTVEILKDGPDTSRAIWVQVRTRPHPYRHRPAPDAFRLVGPDGAERTLAPDLEETRFIELPPGTYTATIDDPRFERWSMTDVALGGSVVADLVASAGARLTVVDAADGTPIDDYRVRVRLDDEADAYTLLDADDDRPSDGVLRVLPQGQTLLVSADGFTDAEVPLAGLQPGDVRDVSAALERE